MSYYADNDDLRFHVEQSIDWAAYGWSILITLIVWPLAGFFRRRFEAEVPEGRIPSLGRLLVWLPSLLFLVFIVGMAVALSDPGEIARDNTGTLSMLLWLPVIGGVMTAIAVFYAILLWLARGGTTFGRVCFTLAAVACMSFIWQLYTMNALGWKL